MTIGIYALYWEQAGSIYIGQSVEIERRWLAHKYKLIHNNHENWNISKLYEKYGEPYYIVLEHCELNVLNSKEISWYNEFDSPINIQEVGIAVGRGLKNPNSKHPKARILRVFSLLYRTKLDQHSISNKTGIPRGTLSHIVCGKAHHWLKEEYPEQYAKMLQVRLEKNRAYWRNYKN